MLFYKLYTSQTAKNWTHGDNLLQSQLANREQGLQSTHHTVNSSPAKIGLNRKWVNSSQP